MKKVAWLLLLILMLGGCSGGRVKNEQNNLLEATITQETLNQVATLVIEAGEEVATYSGQVDEGMTVLKLLNTVAADNAVVVETKTYDFGTMVEAIGGKQNSTKMAWIYYVNGKAGDVGAGEKPVQAGDIVEWKYIPPIY